MNEMESFLEKAEKDEGMDGDGDGIDYFTDNVSDEEEVSCISFLLYYSFIQRNKLMLKWIFNV